MALQDTLNTIQEITQLGQAALSTSTNATAVKVSAALPAVGQLATVIAQHPQPLTLMAALMQAFAQLETIL